MFRTPLIILSLLIAFSHSLLAQKEDSVVIRRIFAEALSDSTAYHNLRFLCTGIGGRLCGSPQAEKAVRWSEKLLEGMDLDTVFLQEVKVRHWVRGNIEKLEVNPGTASGFMLHACAIGGSIGTDVKGVTGNVIEVHDFDELKKLGRKNIEGNIVFFNHTPNPFHYNTFEAYSELAQYRVYCVDYASSYGAKAVVVRSATLAHDDFPHTGIIYYADTVKKIPAMAISSNDAERLSSFLKSNPHADLLMQMACNEQPEVTSYNVIGEIRGTIHPEKVIAFGGHLDSWDLGQGASDDGTGVIQTIEVLRLFKKLGLKPNYTLRVVVFMDEEMAQRGAAKYAEFAKQSDSTSGIWHPASGIRHQKHLAAIEADRGGFTPFGFSIDATDDQVKKIQGWKNLLLPYGLYMFDKGGSGVDIGDLKDLGTPLIGLVTDSQRYFDYHHSAQDTFDKVNQRELQLGSFTIASLVYLIDKYGIK
jgi:carboxypeptidase Q